LDHDSHSESPDQLGLHKRRAEEGQEAEVSRETIECLTGMQATRPPAAGHHLQAGQAEEPAIRPDETLEEGEVVNKKTAKRKAQRLNRRARAEASQAVDRLEAPCLSGLFHPPTTKPNNLQPTIPSASKTAKNKPRRAKKHRADEEKAFKEHGQCPTSKTHTRYVSNLASTEVEANLPMLPASSCGFQGSARGAFGNPSTPRLDALLAEGYSVEKWDGRYETIKFNCLRIQQ
jgi:hypothetical protein